MNAHAEAKARLRKEILDARNLLRPVEIADKSAIIMSKIIEQKVFCTSQTLMCYMDFRNEVMTGAFIRHCFGMGKKVSVPKVVKGLSGQREMIAVEIKDTAESFQTGSFGILEPVEGAGRRVTPGEIDLIIVPGVAYDYKRHRMGYGAGFYDRFLKDVKADCVKIGVGFDIQIRAALPAEAHDIPMDLVITESRII